MRTMGNALREQRTKLRMSLEEAEEAMGGSPSFSVLARIELGKAHPGPEMCERIAKGLMLSRDVLMNAYGYATPWQEEEAQARLLRIVRETPWTS